MMTVTAMAPSDPRPKSLFFRAICVHRSHGRALCRRARATGELVSTERTSVPVVGRLRPRSLAVVAVIVDLYEQWTLEPCGASVPVRQPLAAGQRAFAPGAFAPDRRAAAGVFVPPHIAHEKVVLGAESDNLVVATGALLGGGGKLSHNGCEQSTFECMIRCCEGWPFGVPQTFPCGEEWPVSLLFASVAGLGALAPRGSFPAS